MPSTLAVAAKSELESEVFREAIARMEERWLDRIRNSEPDEIEDRENAYRMLRTIANFIDELHGMLSDAAHERGRAEAERMMRQ